MIQFRILEWWTYPKSLKPHSLIFTKCLNQHCKLAIYSRKWKRIRKNSSCKLLPTLNSLNNSDQILKKKRFEEEEEEKYLYILLFPNIIIVYMLKNISSYTYTHINVVIHI